MSPPCSSSSPIDSPRPQTLTLTLIPGLPNDLSSLILSFIPYSHHSRLKPTCKSWRIFFTPKTLIPIRHNHLSPSQLSHLLCIFPQDPSIASPYLFDPQTLAWSPLPPMPCNPHVYGLCNFTSISVHHRLYVIGGSLFDTRSFPIDRPSPSSAAFMFDFLTFRWTHLSPMLSPRGSFACAVDCDRIVVAGGGSRHTLFGAAGSRMSSAEMYDIGRDEWVALDGLPRFRAGCVGFMVRNGGGGGGEFWVMGGYGESRTVSGVFPVDEYYRDAVVMDLKDGGNWREVGDMWREGERRRLGKIVVVEDHGCGVPGVFMLDGGDIFRFCCFAYLKDGGNWREIGDMWREGERRRLGKIVVVEDHGCRVPGIFMLDGSDIFRYDMGTNQWWKETSVPRKAADDSSVGFVALDGELNVMTFQNAAVVDSSADSRWPRQQHQQHQKKVISSLYIQMYNPRKRSWRSVITKPPLNHHFDFKAAVMCTIRL